MIAALLLGACSTIGGKPVQPAAPEKFGWGHPERAARLEARVFGAALPFKAAY